jgi:hypothetical protein
VEADAWSWIPDASERESGQVPEPEPDSVAPGPDGDATSVADAEVVSEAGTDAGWLDGGVGRCDNQAPIRLYEWNVAVPTTTDNMDFVVKLENHTLMPVPLQSLTARYYFTNEIAKPWTVTVYYSDICCSVPDRRIDSHVVASCNSMPSASGADSYLEFGFDATAGVLAPGDTVQVELAFHADLFDRNLTQDNDYSYTPIRGTQAEWDACPGGACAKFRSCTITAYRDGVLVWGTPP